MSADLQAILEEFDIDDEQMKKLARLILQVCAGSSRKNKEMHDMTYKGDDAWLEFRALMVQEIRQKHYTTMTDTDARILAIVSIDSREQWFRAFSQRLIPGKKPKPVDPYQFVNFRLRGNGPIYRTFETFRHCAIAEAANGDKEKIRWARKRYRATKKGCELCEMRYEGVEDKVEFLVTTHTLGGKLSAEEEEITGVTK